MFPTITTTQQFKVTPKVTNSKGRPASIDGLLTWASSDESVAHLEVADDTLSATVVAQAPGSYSVTVSGDADLGPDVKTIVGQGTGSVVLGEATNIGFDVGPIEEQP